MFCIKIHKFAKKFCKKCTIYFFATQNTSIENKRKIAFVLSYTGAWLFLTNWPSEAAALLLLCRRLRLLDAVITSSLHTAVTPLPKTLDEEVSKGLVGDKEVSG